MSSRNDSQTNCLESTSNTDDRYDSSKVELNKSNTDDRYDSSEVELNKKIGTYKRKLELYKKRKITSEAKRVRIKKKQKISTEQYNCIKEQSDGNKVNLCNVSLPVCLLD